MPRVAVPPVVPFTCQVTLVSLLLTTVAENAWLLPTCTLADVGSTLTARLGAAGVLSPPPPHALTSTVSSNAPITQCERSIEIKG